MTAFDKQTLSLIATKTMHNIGKMLFTIGNLETALIYFKLSLNMNLKLLNYSNVTSSVLSHAAANQFDVSLTLYYVACIYYDEGDVNAATKTLIKLTNVYYDTIKQHDLPENNRKDAVIILIRALFFLANAQDVMLDCTLKRTISFDKLDELLCTFN